VLAKNNLCKITNNEFFKSVYFSDKFSRQFYKESFYENLHSKLIEFPAPRTQTLNLLLKIK